MTTRAAAIPPMRTATPMAMPAAAPLEIFLEDFCGEAVLVLVLAADVARVGEVLARLVE